MPGATSWEADKQWAERYQPFVLKALREHAGVFVEVRPATDEEDCKRATDCVVTFSAGDVAVRFRRSRRDFRDWTVRSRRESGAETELAKLRRGLARWYLMAWTDPGGLVLDHVLIDLDRVRRLGILDGSRREYPNGDGTWFIAVRVSELREAGCLVVDECRSPSPLPRRGPTVPPKPAIIWEPLPEKKKPEFEQGELF